MSTPELPVWIACVSGSTLHVQGSDGRPKCIRRGAGYWMPVSEHHDPSYFDNFPRCEKCTAQTGASINRMDRRSPDPEEAR